MVFEVLDNSIDEHLAGFCSKIDVAIHVDGSVSVRDNGRGIPVDIHPKWKMPAVELVLTNLHAGGKFGQGAYKYSGGLHGVGAKCVNALSDWFKVEVTREGKVYQDDGAERALANYFTPSNLTALRELALRRTAESVDEQLRQHRRVRGVEDLNLSKDVLCIGVIRSPRPKTGLLRRILGLGPAAPRSAPA